MNISQKILYKMVGKGEPHAPCLRVIVSGTEVTEQEGRHGIKENHAGSRR